MNEKFKKEDKRKLFHLILGIIIGVFVGLDRLIGLVLLLALFFWGVPHYIYSKKRQTPITLKRIMEIVEREGKKGEGALTFVLGCLIVVLIFPNDFSIPGIFVLAFSDAIASKVGILHGKRGKNKTVEGSIAFFLASIVVLNFFFSFYMAVVVGFLVAVIEYYVKRDNLIIPFSTSLLVYILPI